SSTGFDLHLARTAAERPDLRPVHIKAWAAFRNWGSGGYNSSPFVPRSRSSVFCTREGPASGWSREEWALKSRRASAYLVHRNYVFDVYWRNLLKSLVGVAGLEPATR